MNGLESYYALSAAKEKAEKDKKNWDTLSQSEIDIYIESQMSHRGFVKGDYLGQGAYKWNKK